MRRTLLLTVVTSGFLTAGSLHGQDGQDTHPGTRTEPLDIEMFYQFSETDRDAEVTIGIESPDNPVDWLVIIGPRGRTVATVRSHDQLGLAEIELESAEPSVEAVQRAYPTGTYWFFGRSVNGAGLHGRATLTHDVIAGPDFGRFSPCGEEVDGAESVSLAWSAVAGAAGYEIIIEQDETGGNLRITQGADRTSFTIPEGFLQPGLEYEVEMKSVTAGGNKTSASCEFNTK